MRITERREYRRRGAWMNCRPQAHEPGRSSRLLREELPWLGARLPSLWTNSYFVATVGGAPLSVIKRYVETQKDR